MSDNQRWAWPTTSTTRWTHDEIEELKHELSCTARGLDPFFERCADALGSLQFDLIDATKAYDVVIAEHTAAEAAALKARADRALQLSRCEEVCSNLMKMLRAKQDAMEVLFDRLTKAGVDCSDLFS